MAWKFLSFKRKKKESYDDDSGFPDGKDGVFSREPDITGTGKIDTAADTVPIDGGNNGFPAFFNGGNTLLELYYFPAEPVTVNGRPIPEEGLSRNKVQAGGKALSLCPDDNDTHIEICIEFFKNPAHLLKKLHGHSITLFRPIQNQPCYMSDFFDLKKRFTLHNGHSFYPSINSIERWKRYAENCMSSNGFGQNRFGTKRWF